MKLFTIYKTDMLNNRERMETKVTCAWIPLFSCSWAWLCKIIRPFYGKDTFIVENDEFNKPYRETVIDYTTNYILYGKNKGQKVITE